MTLIDILEDVFDALLEQLSPRAREPDPAALVAAHTQGGVLDRAALAGALAARLPAGAGFVLEVLEVVGASDRAGVAEALAAAASEAQLEAWGQEPEVVAVLRWAALALGASGPQLDRLLEYAIPYGPYELRQDDRDRGKASYGGQPVPAGAPPRDFVARLQADLRAVGILIHPPASDGTFRIRTKWAVRELQIYASMPHVATITTPGAPIYADRLGPVANPRPYAGPKSGRLDAATAAHLRRWVAAGFRCPVVIEARVASRGGLAGGPGLPQENLWYHDDLEDPAPRMFVRDLSGYYTQPAARAPDRAPDRIVLGDWGLYEAAPKPKRGSGSPAVAPKPERWSGPQTVAPRATWTGQGGVAFAEMTPAALTGQSLTAMAAAADRSTWSTYKVIRAVAEVEASGYFDSVNSYDRAFASVGPCHWTAGPAKGPNRPATRVEPGEMWAFAADLLAHDRKAFGQALGFFGIDVEQPWPIAPDGAATRTATVELGGAPVPQTVGEMDYFRSWHWLYRFVMAGRTNEGWRRRQWPMARRRIQDVLSLPWRVRTGGSGVADLVAGGRPTLGHVVTSERAVALVIRWHVNMPKHMVGPRGPGTKLEAAFARARAADPKRFKESPERWGDAAELLLLDALRVEAAAAHDEIKRSIPIVDRWPQRSKRGYVLTPEAIAAAFPGRPREHALRTDRTSFAFDARDL